MLPRVDIQETDRALIFDFEMPGIDKKDIGVNLQSTILTISGKRTGVDVENYYLNERRKGEYERSFILPLNIDKSSIRAKYFDGILNINIPKLKKVKRVKIDVK